MVKYIFKYWYEWGASGDCLWAADKVTEEKYGYNPAIESLPLSHELVALTCKKLNTLYFFNLIQYSQNYEAIQILIRISDNPDSIMSSSHGAGRVYSRTAAKSNANIQLFAFYYSFS